MRGLGGIRARAALAGGLIAVLAASGCASMSEQECRAGDWEAIGRADGERGARGDEVERRQKSCARHEVAVSEDAWRAGYAKGLEVFCSPKGGYAAARSGQLHHDVCFGFEQEPKFLEAFGHGKEVHALLGEIRKIKGVKRDFDMAALSGDYSDYEMDDMRRRAAMLESELQRREWQLDKLDKEYSAQYGVPPLTLSDLNR